MAFIHGYLLGGLLLAGLPVLLHLLMRQKPRRLSFPAFRFLKAKQRVNQRKIRLQHLLLLLLRMAVIALLCLALARPRIFASRSGDGAERAVVAVVLVDTSASMDYAVAGVTRLDDVRGRVRELLDEMNDGSRVALLDGGDDSAPVFLPRGEVRVRLDALRIRPAAGSLNLAVERALRRLESDDADEGTPRLLYVFTDRTRASWDPRGVVPKVPDGVTVLVVDVGVEAPRDLEVERVEVVPPIVAPGGGYKVRVSVRGTPTGHENELACLLDGNPLDKKPISLPIDRTSSPVEFEGVAPLDGADQTADTVHQITVRLVSRDALAMNDTRHASFLVRGSRRLLTLVETRDERKLRVWKPLHEVTPSFRNDIRTFAEADKLPPKDLATYSVIALFQVTTVPDGWWKKLADRANVGVGIAIIPGGDEVVPGLEKFNREGVGAKVLPAPLDRLVDTPRLTWQFRGGHALMKPFVDWSRNIDTDFVSEEGRPFVRRYWQLGPRDKDAIDITSYTNGKPALVERLIGKGKAILFTSPLDIRYLAADGSQQWNNYWTSSAFGLILVDRVCRYLGGEDSTTPELNFVCGQVPTVALPAGAVSPLSLGGPGLSGPEKALKSPAPDKPLSLPQAVMPGNYLILDAKDRPVAGFSVNLPPRETALDRVPIEELETVLGKDTVIRPGQAASLGDVLRASRPAPIELLPAMMIALLVFLTVESLLANRFYKRPAAQELTIRQITAPMTAKGNP